MTNTNPINKVYFTISIDSKTIGKLHFQLYQKNVPKTCQNFIQLCTSTTTSSSSAGVATPGYRNSCFHRIIPGFMIQGGDYENRNGTGGKSIYQKNPSGNFDDENFLYSHHQRGMLSMANSGPNTNGSQFFITFRPTNHLDGKHVVFGCVDPTCTESQRVLDLLEQVPTVKKGAKRDFPKIPVTIVDCGLVHTEKQVKDKVPIKKMQENDGKGSSGKDDDEIDLDDEEEDETEPTKEDTTSPLESNNNSNSNNNGNGNTPKNDTDSTEPPSKALTPLQKRLMKLRMKMNQSRVLNRKEVLSEGERMTSAEGKAHERKRLHQLEKQRKDKEWESCHGKALQSATSFLKEQAGKGDDRSVKNHVKAMVQPASDNIKKTSQKRSKAEMNRFDVNDYYNPEGQHRNYERSLRSIHPSSNDNDNNDNNDTFDISDPTKLFQGMNATNSMGAKRLANEMKRRVEKTKASKKKKQRMDFESTDINYVDKRNKHFNEKISRTYDAHTAEIRQNLERGTAL